MFGKSYAAFTLAKVPAPGRGHNRIGRGLPVVAVLCVLSAAAMWSTLSAFAAVPTAGLTVNSPLVDTPTNTATNTATNTRTNTPTRTATLAPSTTPTATSTTTALLVAHVTGQGLPAQPSAMQQLPITLTLTQGGTATEYPVQLTDAGGYFTTSLGTLPLGVYTWKAKGTMFLRNAGTFTLTAGVNNLEMGLMRTGDMNGDNVTDVADFNNFKGNYGLAGNRPQDQPSGAKGP